MSIYSSDSISTDIFFNVLKRQINGKTQNTALIGTVDFWLLDGV
jgi:hypothetical protein